MLCHIILFIMIYTHVYHSRFHITVYQSVLINNTTAFMLYLTGTFRLPCLTWLQPSSRQGKGLLNLNSAIEEVSHQRQQSRAPQRSLHDKFVGRSRLYDCPFCIVLYRIAMLFEIDSLVPATFPARIIFFSNSTMR